MSNWEARQLSAKQMQYGALDAIITGHIYRGLRLWHASPSACTACRQMLGAVSTELFGTCLAILCLQGRCCYCCYCCTACLHPSLLLLRSAMHPLHLRRG